RQRACDAARCHHALKMVVGSTDVHATLSDVGPWLRLSPAICMIWAAVGTVLASPAILWSLMPFAALGAVFPWHPFDAIYNYGLRHWLGTPRLPRYRAPRRFACAVATIWLGAAGLAFYLGEPSR